MSWELWSRYRTEGGPRNCLVLDRILVHRSYFPGSCSALAWTINALTLLGHMGPAVFTLARAYALSGRNRLFGLAMLTFSATDVVLYWVFAFWLTPAQSLSRRLRASTSGPRLHACYRKCTASAKV
ncbi:hypothetical protein C8Q77DRAFT_824863 [Trametes polyzona]|nr:hypothetical protein C8Q77DRAFT_824863 [Trametes polyzona]